MHANIFLIFVNPIFFFGLIFFISLAEQHLVLKRIFSVCFVTKWENESPKTFDEAQAECAAEEDGDLAVPSNKRQYDFIRDMVQSNAVPSSKYKMQIKIKLGCYQLHCRRDDLLDAYQCQTVL